MSFFCPPLHSSLKAPYPAGRLCPLHLRAFAQAAFTPLKCSLLSSSEASLFLHFRPWFRGFPLQGGLSVLHTRETALDFTAVFWSLLRTALMVVRPCSLLAIGGLPLWRTGFTLTGLGPQVAPGSCQVLTRDSWHL